MLIDHVAIFARDPVMSAQWLADLLGTPPFALT